MIDVPALSILAKSGRARILGHLLAHPKQRFTINALAAETGVPFATAWRSVRDLYGLGLATTESFGNSTSVQLNERSPAAYALKNLDFPDPHLMAFRAFERELKRRLPNVSVRLFGSVARGASTPASDVDVAVAYGATGYSKAAVLEASVNAANRVLDDFHLSVTPLLVKRVEDAPK
ncbi:MAG: nucleotidyltransferase domain-containing protein [Euryarchaeota archaeon]|nr:nucleotidyltransferase domain-containing protein [Euryarchaeota archaeon]